MELETGTYRYVKILIRFWEHFPEVVGQTAKREDKKREGKGPEYKFQKTFVSG